MIPIYGKTNEEVWLKAVEHFIENEKDLEYNLILEIKKPTSTNVRSKAIRNELDNLLEGAGKYSINTVAETIFPAAEYKKYGVKGVFDIYPDTIYPQIRKKAGNNKGTYALRIVRGKDPKGNECNPLSNVLARLRKQLDRDKGAVRCCYELAFDDLDASDTITINRNDTSIQGFPCLSHLSFKLNEDRSEVILTAIYRSQYYAQKALGNLRGLSRLQSFVARELGIAAGPLVCHATYAKLDTCPNLGVNKLEELVKKIKDDFDEIA